MFTIIRHDAIGIAHQPRVMNHPWIHPRIVLSSSWRLQDADVADAGLVAGLIHTVTAHGSSLVRAVEDVVNHVRQVRLVLIILQG